jgi:hypothetical protein
MENMEDKKEVIRFIIDGQTEEEVTDQLNQLEIDLIKRYGQQPDGAVEVMAFVASLRNSILAKMKDELHDNGATSVVNKIVNN